MTAPRSARSGDKPKASKSQLGWTLIVLVWLPMAALLVWGRGGILDVIALRKEVRLLQGEVSKLEEENARIRSEINRLQTDPTVYESIARERFFLKKPGERVLYVPGGAALPPPQAPVSTPPPPAAPAPATPPVEKPAEPQGAPSPAPEPPP
jgi:cell division protein FtsB